MKVTIYHTCDANGDIKNIEEIKAHGPFLSTHTKEHPKALGTGCYFFDNHLAAAHKHGTNRYKRKYHIFKSDTFLNEDVFLDLVGNMSCMLFIQAAMKEISEHLDDDDEWTLGHLIEYLKKQGAFFYKAIRVVNSAIMEETPEDVKEEYRLYWFSSKKAFVNLNPIYTICFLSRELLNNFEHHFNSLQKT